MRLFLAYLLPAVGGAVLSIKTDFVVFLSVYAIATGCALFFTRARWSQSSQEKAR